MHFPQPRHPSKTWIHAGAPLSDQKHENHLELGQNCMVGVPASQIQDFECTGSFSLQYQNRYCTEAKTHLLKVFFASLL